MTLPTPSGLSARLKQETRDLHALAERGAVMQALLRGELDRAGYCALLRHLWALYSALEAGLERHAGTSAVRRLWRPSLRRAARLASDLDALDQPGWRSRQDLTPAGQAYVQQLLSLAPADPERLLAHAYVRYLGDLYGGQLLAQRVRHQLGLADGEGTAFYTFDDSRPIEQMRADFRTDLDALTLTPALTEALVAEARAAFVRHREMFDELRPADGARPAEAGADHTVG